MNLYIGNLSPETTENDLLKIFSEFGEIVGIKVIRDAETGMPRGFGFVEMADKFSAFDAIDNIDATFFQGNIISVKEAKPKAGAPGKRNFAPRKPFNRRFNQ
jgi:RNA recognition motif-containing protein